MHRRAHRRVRTRSIWLSLPSGSCCSRAGPGPAPLGRPLSASGSRMKLCTRPSPRFGAPARADTCSGAGLSWCGMRCSPSPTAEALSSGSQWRMASVILATSLTPIIRTSASYHRRPSHAQSGIVFRFITQEGTAEICIRRRSRGIRRRIRRHATPCSPQVTTLDVPIDKHGAARCHSSTRPRYPMIAPIRIAKACMQQK